MNTDSSGLLQAQWNRFNRNFPVPDNEDAQQLAAQVQQSMDAWITSSLDSLQTQLQQNLTDAAQSLQANLAQSTTGAKTAIAALNTQLTNLQNSLPAAGQPLTGANLTAIQDAIKAVQSAVAAQNTEIEALGSTAASTVLQVGKAIIGL
jgi:hypothetical protein